jgi:hypothetical protein
VPRLPTTEEEEEEADGQTGAVNEHMMQMLAVGNGHGGHELLLCLPVLAGRLSPKRRMACSAFAERKQRLLQRAL